MASTENTIVPALDPNSASPSPSRDQTPAVVPEAATATTVPPDFVADLRPAQEKALLAMHEGQGILSAAKAAGVCRATIYYWLKHDPTFIAAHTVWRRQCRQEVTNKLLSLRDKALEVVATALDKGEFRAAAAVLRYIDKQPDGLGDPEKIEDLLDHRTRFPKSQYIIPGVSEPLNERFPLLGASSSPVSRTDMRELNEFIAGLGIVVVDDKNSPAPTLKPSPSATD